MCAYESDQCIITRAAFIRVVLMMHYYKIPSQWCPSNDLLRCYIVVLIENRNWPKNDLVIYNVKTIHYIWSFSPLLGMEILIYATFKITYYPCGPVWLNILPSLYVYYKMIKINHDNIVYIICHHTENLIL